MQMTRNLLTILLAIPAWLTAAAQDQSYADCLSKVSGSWGRTCAKCEIYNGYKRDFSTVYQVQFRNICGEMLEVKMALEEENGSWRTFPVKALAAGDTLSAFACRGTGKYMYWARRVNDTEIILPSDGQIAGAYGGR